MGVTLEELKKAHADGTVDTVLLVIADMEGRLQGKRLTSAHFLHEVVEHGAEGCNYLLAVDVDMNTVEGYAMSALGPRLRGLRDEAGLRHAAADPLARGHVLLMADLEWEDGTGGAGVAAADPAQAAAPPRGAGLAAMAGTELEFIVFRDTYEEAWRKGYRDLEPGNHYNVDYSMIGTARLEPLIRRIRNSMMGAGMAVENSKGECNFGQHEINFRYSRRAHHGRQPRDLQDGREGDRVAGGLCDHLHRQVQRARGQLVPHPSVARARGRHAICSPGTTACSRASLRASSPGCASSR